MRPPPSLGPHRATSDGLPRDKPFTTNVHMRLLPVFGEQLLLEVRDADRDELERGLVDAGHELALRPMRPGGARTGIRGMVWGATGPR